MNWIDPQNKEINVSRMTISNKAQIQDNIIHTLMFLMVLLHCITLSGTSQNSCNSTYTIYNDGIIQSNVGVVAENALMSECRVGGNGVLIKMFCHFHLNRYVSFNIRLHRVCTRSDTLSLSSSGLLSTRGVYILTLYKQLTTTDHLDSFTIIAALHCLVWCALWRRAMTAGPVAAAPGAHNRPLQQLGHTALV
jgi:hypothetical protein